MPTMIKPRTLGVLTKIEPRPAGASFIISALGLFDLAHPQAPRFETDQTLWILAAKALPKGTILDLGMPKPCAELLVGGSAVAPHREAVSAMMLEWQVGALHKRLAVIGDRFWQVGHGGVTQTPPVPFVEMPLDPARTFGGPGHPDNPNGVGFRAADRIQAREVARLPNIERPERLIRTIDDTPSSALCGPMDPASPKRRRFAGTYDQAWIKTQAPCLPNDVDPRLFLVAPEDQQFPTFLEGGEPYALRGFCADAPELGGHLPRFRVRAFLARKRHSETPAELAEMAMRIDTLWLIAGARRGVLIFRGALPITDPDADDISHVMLAYEERDGEPRPKAHYEEVWRLRSDREQAFRHAFSEHQLAPAPSAEVTARRAAERSALQRARLEQHAADQRWLVERQLRASGLPEALWPAVPEPDIDSDLAALPIPTPEELQSGEIDLATLLDAIEAFRKKLDAQLDAAMAQVAPLQDATRQLAAPDAGPESVDGLFSALDSLGVGDLPSQMDATLAAVRPPEMSIETDPRKIEAVAAQVESVKDWRGAVLDAFKPRAADEDSAFAAARARFLDLPEAQPLHEARQALAAAGGAEPDVAPPPEARGGQASSVSGMGPALSDLLDQIDRKPDAHPDTAPALRQSLAEAEDKLRAALPNLPADGSPLDALLAALAPPAETAGEDPREALSLANQKRAASLAEAAATLDRQEPRIADSLAEMRRRAPIATSPKQLLSRSVARRLGDLILAEARAGRSLRGADMAGADLRGADLRNVDLEGALLERADLGGACLAGSRLVNAALTEATLDGADLAQADLTEANLARCRARGASFVGATLSKTLLIEAELAEARFEGALLKDLQFLMVQAGRARFAGAAIDSTVFIRCGLDGSAWDGVMASRVQFIEAALSHSSWRGASLTRCALIKIVAPDADFREAQLSHCSFLGEADLAGACFAGARGDNVGFGEAILRGADFAGARFDRSGFGGAKLAGASFRLASLKETLFGKAQLTGADFVGANLFKAQLRRADLAGARLVGASLYAATLNDADLTGADLTGANLARTLLDVDTHVG